MSQDKGIVVYLLEGDRLVLESTVWGSPSYRVGDTISVVTGYRRGIDRRKLIPTRYQVIAVEHLIRRVEQPHEVMRYEFCLQVQVIRLTEP